MKRSQKEDEEITKEDEEMKKEDMELPNEYGGMETKDEEMEMAVAIEDLT